MIIKKEEGQVIKIKINIIDTTTTPSLKSQQTIITTITTYYHLSTTHTPFSIHTSSRAYKEQNNNN